MNCTTRTEMKKKKNEKTDRFEKKIIVKIFSFHQNGGDSLVSPIFTTATTTTPNTITKKRNKICTSFAIFTELKNTEYKSTNQCNHHRQSKAHLLTQLKRLSLSRTACNRCKETANIQHSIIKNTHYSLRFRDVMRLDNNKYVTKYT